MSSYQDTLDEGEKIELAFKYDVRLIKDVKAPEYHRYRYEAPQQQTLYWDVSEKGHARIFTQLQAHLGGFRYEEIGKKGIPLTVARSGQEELVAFLFGYPKRCESPRHIARRFDIERQTIYQYLTRVRDKAPEPLADAKE